MVEYLPSMNGILGSVSSTTENHSTTKQTNKQRHETHELLVEYHGFFLSLSKTSSGFSHSLCSPQFKSPGLPPFLSLYFFLISSLYIP